MKKCLVICVAWTDASFFVSDKGPPPPGVAVAARRILQDENDEPQYGDRVPYVIVRGDPHTRLVERAITPEEFLANRYILVTQTHGGSMLIQNDQATAHRCILLHLKGADTATGAHLQPRGCGRPRMVRRDAENDHRR